MKIKWLGHACFLIEGERARILIDPFDDSVGYPIVNQKVDILTISHGHGDHCDTSWVEYEHQICIPDTFHVVGVEIKGYVSYHDNVGGKQRGDNVIFKFKIDGFTICHLGDLGHLLPDELISKISRPDVLMIPVGGNYTLDGVNAAKVIEQLKPKFVLPMHHKTDVCRANIGTAKEFMDIVSGEYSNSNSVEILKGSTGVLALNYK